MKAVVTFREQVAPSRITMDCPDAGIVNEERPFTPEDRRTLEQLISRYNQSGGSRTELSQRQLREIGEELFFWFNQSQQWLSRLLERQTEPPLILELIVPRRPGEDSRILLAAPWELAFHQNRFLAADIYIRFCPLRRVGPPTPPTAPSPWNLHALFMAASPEGPEKKLDYEAEETAILEIAGKAGLSLTVEESGEAGQLAIRLANMRTGADAGPEILHISCHGLSRQVPVLLLEDEQGLREEVAAEELSRQLTGGLPRLIAVSACETAQANRFANAFAFDLVRAGARNVLGWDGPVGDEEAAWFASEFYRRLALKNTVPDALAAAREAIVAKGGEKFPGVGSIYWHKARLYIGSEGGGVLAEGTKTRRRVNLHEGHKEMLDKNGEAPVANRWEFVGRRREIQTIIREIRDPQSAGILIHGMGRQGKSSLAARVVNRLGNSFQMVYLHSGFTIGGLLDALEYYIGNETMRQLSIQRRAADLNQPRALYTLMREILENGERYLPEQRALLLVIDNVEQALIPPPGSDFHRVHPHFHSFFRELLEAFIQQAGGTSSRLMLISRYRFSLPGNPGPGRPRDLCDRLTAVHLPPMKRNESLKQAETRKHHAKTPGAKLTEQDLKKMVFAARGNPGLQDLLHDLSEENGHAFLQACEELTAFHETGALPSSPALKSFLGDLSLDPLLARLDPSELKLLQAVREFGFPISRSVLEAAATEAGCADGKKAADRLLAFGLMDAYPDLSNPLRPAAALNPLLRGKTGELPPDDRELRDNMVKGLEKAWRPEEGETPSPAAEYYLQRITSGVSAVSAEALSGEDPGDWGAVSTDGVKGAGDFRRTAARNLDLYW